MKVFNFKAFANFTKRNKLYTTINVFGFAASLMFVILLGLYIQKELSVDTWHSKGGRIYRMVTDGDTYTYAAPIAKDIESRYPEIESVVRVKNQDVTVDMLSGEKIIAKGLMVDSCFFNVFDFPLISGNSSAVLATPDNVVMSESFAIKMFGDAQSAVGKTIKAGKLEFMVSGVAADFENTQFQKSDIIIPFKALPRLNNWPDILDQYGMCNYAFFVLERENADLKSKLPDMAEFFKSINYWIFSNGYAKEVVLVPLSDAYFASFGYSPGLISNDRSFLTILGFAALMILFFAVINYINLSVAQAGFRAKEAATRRLFGGTRFEVFSNFIVEAWIFCGISFIIAMFFADLSSGWFNSTLGSDIDVYNSFDIFNIIITVSGITLLGVVAGIFPAWVISQFKPIEVVRGTFRRKTKMVYSKILIAFQYCITIILLGCTITVVRQTLYMKTADMGFKRDNIAQIDNSMGNKVWGIKDKLLSIPGVKAVSFVQGSPIDGGNNNSMSIDDVNYSFQTFGIDTAGMAMLGFEVILETGNNADSAIWINEAAYNKLNLKRSGKAQFNWYGTERAMRGVVKNFNFNNLSEQVKEAMIYPFGQYKYDKGYGASPWAILVQFTGDNQYDAAKAVEEAYKDFSGGQPCDMFFFNEQVNRWYEKQDQTIKIIGMLSILAIIIAALGILAMSMYFMRQRIMEVAVRKVFGSTRTEVIRELIKSFLNLIAIAFVISLPFIWYFMSGWLEGYAYRIDLSWYIYVAAGLVTFIVTISIVLWQSILAANANPIHSLKNN